MSHKIRSNSLLFMLILSLICSSAQAQDQLLIKNFKGHLGEIQSLAFSPDGASVVTASTDKTARIWKLASYRDESTVASTARR